MKARIVLNLIFILLLVSSARSQSVYYFRYKFPTLSDTNVYHAFFVRYSDGFGFMRVRFDEPGTGQPIVAQMNLWQNDIQLDPGGNDKTRVLVDTNKIRFDTTGKPRFIFGSSKTRLPAPSFLFNRNKTSNLFDPGSITTKDSRGIEQNAEILSSETYTAETLDKDIVAQFFTPEEDFIKNMNDPGSRGITNLSPVEKKMKIHLLIVANTNDPSIGRGCAYDIRIAMLMLDSIRKFIGIGMQTTVISGKNYNKENVQKAIKALNPDPNDIVIFFYSGHGFRKPEDNRIFPYIDLRSKPDRTYNVNSLNIQDVFDAIRTKPKAARLNLVISDCCNTLPETKKSTAKVIGGGFRDINQWSEANCRKLFLDPAPMSILMTAAEVNQMASYDTTAGSLFTIYFKAALENFLSKSKSNVSWDQVVTETKDKVSFKAAHTYCLRPFIPENICKQEPIRKVMPGRGN